MRKQLIDLREFMQEHGIDACYIPTDDDHASEYVGDYYKAREYISGFTGSAGKVIVTKEKAILWTDGRYFLQAEQQLKDSGFELYKSGMEGVPTIEEYARNEWNKGTVLAFDGRVTDGNTGEMFAGIIKEKNGKLITDLDFIDAIWTDRPEISKKPAFELPVSYCGESRVSKCNWLAEEVKNAGCDYHVMAALDDICWLLNIRGDDVSHVPVMLSYLIMDHGKITLYAMDEAVQPVRAALEKDGISIRPYGTFYDDLARIPENATVLLDKGLSNYQMISLIKGEIVNRENPCILRKSKKNPTEIANIRNAHIKDGVAMCRFICWLKNEIKKENHGLTEISVSDKLEQFRREQGALDISFDTISGYNSNGAIIHYEPDRETAAPLSAEGLLLLDSGGHYMEGSTDITRTIALGDIPDEWKYHYTLVLKSMLRLANAKFLYGCSGVSLDILSRGPLWERGLDYRHGTGHGVGYLLNIHEAPNGFRYRLSPDRNDGCILEEGMITTDEPGLYIEGSHGIRIENELLCKKANKNEYGQFMEFETITYVPIDLEAIDTKYLTDEELDYLNAYHKLVYDVISPYLKGDELSWLKMVTQKSEK